MLYVSVVFHTGLVTEPRPLKSWPIIKFLVFCQFGGFPSVQLRTVSELKRSSCLSFSLLAGARSAYCTTMARFHAEMLLELVRPHRFLYDNREADFKDTQMKENRWTIIGKELGISGERYEVSVGSGLKHVYFQETRRPKSSRTLRTAGED